MNIQMFCKKCWEEFLKHSFKSQLATFYVWIFYILLYIMKYIDFFMDLTERIWNKKIAFYNWHQHLFKVDTCFFFMDLTSEFEAKK